MGFDESTVKTLMGRVEALPFLFQKEILFCPPIRPGIAYPFCKMKICLHEVDT